VPLLGKNFSLSIVRNVVEKEEGGAERKRGRAANVIDCKRVTLFGRQEKEG